MGGKFSHFPSGAAVRDDFWLMPAEIKTKTGEIFMTEERKVADSLVETVERGRETPADQDEKKRGRILIFALDQLPSIFSTFLVNFLSSSEALRKWVRSSTSSLVR